MMAKVPVPGPTMPSYRPMPKPMATALTKFWMGNTSESAVMACSLIWATKRLSTMLYRLFTSIEMTLGRAMESSSGNTGLVFIKVSFIFIAPEGQIWV